MMSRMVYPHAQTEQCRPRYFLCRRILKAMFRSVVTVTKITLVFLNIWVLAVVLVVSLGHWRVFDSNDPTVTYDNSHLIVMRNLQEEGDRIISPSTNASSHKNGMPIPPQQNVPPNNAAAAAAAPHKDAVLAPAAAAAPLPQSPQDSRIANLKHLCKQQHPHSIPLDKIPKSKLSSILVDEKHKLLFCQIPGVAINDWRKLMLILNGVVNVTSTSAISGGDVYGKYAKSSKRLSDFGDKERKEMLSKYFKAVFVRDPLERLVVAYETKLKTKSSKYFHRAFGSPIIKKYRKKATEKEIKEGNSVLFSEFVKYIIDNEHEGKVALNEHWEQYYKQCHPCLVNYDFVGTYENVEADTAQVMEKINAKSIKPPYIQDTRSIPQKELTKYYSATSPQELNNLYKVFSADYTLFSYPCPEFVHGLLEKGDILHDY